MGDNFEREKIIDPDKVTMLEGLKGLSRDLGKGRKSKL
jgi:hypothetical protein